MGLDRLSADAEQVGPRYTLETSPPGGALLDRGTGTSLSGSHFAFPTVLDQSGTVSPTRLDKAC